MHEVDKIDQEVPRSFGDWNTTMKKWARMHQELALVQIYSVDSRDVSSSTFIAMFGAQHQVDRQVALIVMHRCCTVIGVVLEDVRLVLVHVNMGTEKSMHHICNVSCDFVAYPSAISYISHNYILF